MQVWAVPSVASAAAGAVGTSVAGANKSLVMLGFGVSAGDRVRWIVSGTDCTDTAVIAPLQGMNSMRSRSLSCACIPDCLGHFFRTHTYAEMQRKHCHCLNSRPGLSEADPAQCTRISSCRWRRRRAELCICQCRLVCDLPNHTCSVWYGS